ncbi:MAG TPA: hypothetical protein VE174_03515 [Actinomycetota bacterium]|nr:hypothetical protein [Actinomycetota bacterium]
MRSKGAAVLATAALFFSATPIASAHEESALHALSVIDAVTPQVPGLSFRVIQITQPVLFARNHTGRTLTVFGEKGEPFLRLRDGRVETNLHSSLTYTSRDPMGPHGAAPTDLNPAGKPDWSLLSRRDSWSWFDPRIRFAGSDQHTWEVRAKLGNQDVAITGSFESLTGHGHFATQLEPPRDVSNLEIRLLDGLVPAVYVRNDTRKTLRVSGRHGEPFLEIGPRGVFANLRSPDYYLGGNQTVRNVPRSADPEARPQWERLSEVPIWSWLEFRARLPAQAHQRSTLGSERKVILTWITPMVLGEERLPLKGSVVWNPPRRQSSEGERSSTTTVWLSAIGGVLIVVGAALLARRRRLSAG